MKILTINDHNTLPLTATIGFFDGVHTGHRHLIRQVIHQATIRNQQTMIITFRNHPRLHLDPNCGLRQLTTTDERLQLLSQTNIDYTLLLDFDPHIATLTSTQFMTLLHNQYNLRTLLIGHDHHFGTDRHTTFHDYSTIGSTIGIQLIQATPYTLNHTTISSSKIRKALATHHITTANRHLGYPYTITGTITHGNKIGRTIHYPTANLTPPPLKLLPANGVYAALATIDHDTHPAMVNIGTRPTISGTHTTIEAHIIDLSRDLYNKTLTLQLIRYIRPEQKFDTLDDLRHQLDLDRLATIQTIQH